jgi:hypothetical protein
MGEPQRMRELILDMDSSVSETYGKQEGAAYNGHFANPWKRRNITKKAHAGRGQETQWETPTNGP